MQAQKGSVPTNGHVVDRDWDKGLSRARRISTFEHSRVVILMIGTSHDPNLAGSPTISVFPPSVIGDSMPTPAVFDQRPCTRHNLVQRISAWLEKSGCDQRQSPADPDFVQRLQTVTSKDKRYTGPTSRMPKLLCSQRDGGSRFGSGGRRRGEKAGMPMRNRRVQIEFRTQHAESCSTVRQKAE